MSRSYTLSEIAERIGARLDGGARVDGDGARLVTRVAALASADPESVTYLDNPKLLRQLPECRAAAIVIAEDIPVPSSMAALRVRQPGVAWTEVLELFHPYERQFTDVAASASVDERARLGPGVGIGPGVTIVGDVEIGARTEIYPGTTIVGPGVRIGEDCRIHGGVHIYHGTQVGDRVFLHAGVVLGADGYGYVQEKTGRPDEPVVHRKVPQVGIVVIEDDVEIGANTTVDRAALDRTVIGRGTKIDNQVMIGHNSRTGAHCLLVAQSGISGSTELGNYVTLAGQSGIAGHLTVGDGATIGARSGVLNHVKAGEVLLGSPALPGLLARKAYSQIEHLPEFRRSIKSLETRLARLERAAEADESTESADGA